jgi:penicillin-binding protein 1A
VVGLQNVIDLAGKLGVAHPAFDPTVMSMPLGTKEVTPLEMASAYSAIPNGGDREPAYFVDRIEDRFGDEVYEHQSEGTQAISADSACYATQILQDNVKSGTGTRARLDQQPAAGKTGTTEDNADAWFVGFTPYLTTAVWMGNPDGRVSMENLNGVENFGGTYPAMIWKAYNDAAHQGLPVVQFPECAKPTRSARIVIGQGNPFLNGWRFGSTGSSNTQRRSSGTGGRGTTTTVPSTGGGPEPTAPPSTAPPPSSTPSTTPGFGSP